MKLSIPVYSVYRAPDSFAGLVKLLKQLAPKGWKLNAKGGLVCKEGFCVLGKLALLSDPEWDEKMPDASRAAEQLDLPESLAERVIWANDGVDEDAEPKHRKQFLKDRQALLSGLRLKDKIDWAKRFKLLDRQRARAW